jgi:outer membrane protein assembly factor BamB
MQTRAAALLFVALVSLSPRPSIAAGVDWYRWRGPDLNGISTETGWSAAWPAGGPKKLWEAQVGIGFASFSVSDGRVFTTGHANKKDTVYCFDAATGKELWKYSFSHPLGDKYYEGGTSATPTVDGKVVYSLSKQGHLFCFDIATGKIVWANNLAEDHGAKVPEWGFASSPVVVSNLLLLNAGTAGLALNKNTGHPVWNNGKEAAGYASAVPFVADGQRRVAIFGAKALYALDLASGKKLWEYPWKTSYDVNAADPIFIGNRVFLSSSYGKGCGLVEFKGGQAMKVYENKYMRNHFNSCVLIGDHLYGTTGESGQASYLMCLDLKTGQPKWQEKSVGLGALMAADGKLIVQGETGELLIVKAQPEKFEALARAKVLTSKRCWTTPVLSQGRIYCRSSEGQVVCLAVSVGP